MWTVKELGSWTSIILLFLLFSSVTSQIQTEEFVTLTPENNFVELKVESGTDVVISVGNLSLDTAFSIIQANVFLGSVTLSYNRTLTQGNYTTGANIGLVLYNNTEKEVFLRQTSGALLNVLLGLQVYDGNAPIPGACNMEQSIRVAPFLPTRFSVDLVTVEFPIASWPMNVVPPTCDGSPLQYDIFHLYLPENDISQETLFKNIRLMSDWKSIQTYGKQVNYFGAPVNQIEFANYVGTGRIISVVVRGLTSSAAYVPTTSYGCTVSSAEEPCELLSSVLEKVFGACLFFIGLFMIAFGHRFFKIQIFLVGFCISMIISFILLFYFSQPSKLDATLIVFGVGVGGGLLLLGIWAWWGVPVLPVFLGCLILGFLVASIIAYSPLVDLSILKDNVTFWLAFLCFVLIGPLFLVSFPFYASLGISTVMGSYFVLFTLDQYVGSNLQYIVINILRRAVNSDFRVAIVDPPFQYRDLVLVIVWALLIFGGIFFQLWRERGRIRPPFPSPPTWPVWLRIPRIRPVDVLDENTPLIS